MNEWNSGENPSGRQYNQLLDAMVTMIKYNKNTIYHTIYIKVFSDGTFSYLTVSTDDFLKNNSNEK